MAGRDDESQVGSTGTVARAVSVLAALADHGAEMGVNQLAETLSLPASTTHRLLKLLRNEDLVEWNPVTRRYGVGPGLYRISARVLESVSLPQLARSYLDRLAARFDETVLLGNYLERQRALSFAARADGQQALQYRINMHVPTSLLWGASGKAILAHLSDQVVAAVLAEEGPSPATGAPLPTLPELQNELDAIRVAGYARSANEKLPGACGIAAPVFGPRGVVGCIVLTAPQERLPREQEPEIIEAVRETARELSDVLGPAAAPRLATVRGRK